MWVPVDGHFWKLHSPVRTVTFFLSFFFNYSFIHMCIHCFGHFSQGCNFSTNPQLGKSSVTWLPI
jgi:hypothetical protein